MAYSLVPGQSIQNSLTAATALSASFNVNTTAGNLVIVTSASYKVLSNVGALTVSDTTGLNTWNIILKATSGTLAATIAWCIVKAPFTQATATWSNACTQVAMTAYEFNGEAASPFDTTSKATGSTANTTVSAGNYTPSGNNELIIVVGGVAATTNPPTWALGAGFSGLLSPAELAILSLGSQYLIQGTNAQIAAAFGNTNGTSGSPWGSVVASFTAARNRVVSTTWM